MTAAVKPARTARRHITRVLEQVRGERYAQHVKWGEQNHPDGTSMAYAGHAAAFRSLCDRRHNDGTGTWLDILLEEVYEAATESDPQALRTELVQVAAVAVAWVEAIDRRADPAHPSQAHP